MPRVVAVTGATGNQGGSVATLLLKHPDLYTVRALTRDASTPAARSLKDRGAELAVADLTKPDTLPAALAGCWGVFGVTNFYDPKIKDDPGSEEQQGKNLVDAARAAGVECFLWSTLPSSHMLSGGKFVSRIYEGKYKVDNYMKEIGYPGVFLYTGNFYENMIYRNHVVYHPSTDALEFRQPIIKRDTKLAMVYVERDLAAVSKALFDQWDAKKDALSHTYLRIADARVSPGDIVETIAKVTGKKVTYTILPTTGVPDRDIMFELYNYVGMYPGKDVPDGTVTRGLGVPMTSLETFVRERLVPYLGLEVV